MNAARDCRLQNVEAAVGAVTVGVGLEALPGLAVVLSERGAFGRRDMTKQRWFRWQRQSFALCEGPFDALLVMKADGRRA